MTPGEFATLRARVQLHEGTGPTQDGRFFPYTDTVGKVTIGWGHNLTDRGISGADAAKLLDDDLVSHIAQLTQTHPIVLTLSAERQIVLGEMAFNLGVPRLSGFKKMWAALAVGDFDQAALEMLDSKWATQVHGRATRLAEELRRGELLNEVV